MEVQICPNCLGNGKVMVLDGIDRGYVNCNRCYASGRIVRKKYQIEMPYGFNQTFFYEVDRNICKEINDFSNKIKITKDIDMPNT